ncbi:MAG: peptidoglycan DD-metalloendopeptidase family protein [Bacteroidota bacterium]
MNKDLLKFFEKENHFKPIIGGASKVEDYFKISLAGDFLNQNGIDSTDKNALKAYLDAQINSNSNKIPFGGYLEKRQIYQQSSLFKTKKAFRNIHLGIDFWAAAGTEILAPLDGIVFQQNYNDQNGDYGGTILLQHEFNSVTFYTLFGHLSKKSLNHYQLGDLVQKGEAFCCLGNENENGGYLPHLHFQIILDLQDFTDNYPGVCTQNTLDFYRNNCPDPNYILQF